MSLLYRELEDYLTKFYGTLCFLREYDPLINMVRTPKEFLLVSPRCITQIIISSKLQPGYHYKLHLQESQFY